MSDIKSYQRLLAVQALYETAINNNKKKIPADELLSYIIENSDFKNKINGSKLLLTKQIYNGVFTNLEVIDSILQNSTKSKSKADSFDKLLLTIFRCAIFELAIRKEISKKIF